MRRSSKCILLHLTISSLCLTSKPARAQDRASETPPGFVVLRPDGNGMSALRATMRVSFDNVPASDAFKSVAAQAMLDLTFDPRLSGLERRITMPARDRSAAAALLEIAERSRVRVIVSPSSGQLVITPEGLPTSASPTVASASDSLAVERRPVLLPAVRTRADYVERREFETKPNVGSVSMSGPQLSSVPRFLAEADVLRAVQLLPGVEARNDYSAGINVRGGEADQNLILLDGYPIYNPFHLGGLFGTFIDPTVGRIELITGGFPARYGGRLSGVLDVRSAEETRRGVHGAAEASLISSVLSLGGAMGDGKGSWMIAGRRTYIDKAVDFYQHNALPYHFRDAQAHVARLLPGDVRLSVTGYDGLDRVDFTESRDHFYVAWGNRVVGSTLSKTFHDRPRLFGLSLGDSVTVEQRLSSSRFNTDVDLANGAFKLRSLVDDRRIGGGLTVFTPRHDWTFGYEVASQRLSYWVNRDVPLFPVDSLGGVTRSASFFVDDLWRLMPSLLIQAGVRVDALDAPRWTGAQPRLSAKYFVNDNFALTAAVGQYAQWVRSLSREDIPIRPLDFWIGSDASTPVSRAWHYVAGFERWATPRRMLRVEGFYKSYRDLLEPNPRADALLGGDEFLATAGGSSYGADLVLRQFDGKRFSGWLAYTYTVSARIDADGTRHFAAQDRRHDVNLVGSWQFAKYTLGARFGVATGTPYTHVRGDFVRHEYDPATHDFPEAGSTDVQYLVGPRNGERLPIAHRLDVSAMRHGRLFGASVSPYLSISNAYNARNVFAYVFDYSKLPPTRFGLPQSPILPTIGLSVVW